MRHFRLPKFRTAASAVALAFVATAAPAQSRVVLPAGSVIIVRTTTPLLSATAKAGQTFETNVEESIGVDEFAVIPAGSKIRGVVSMATPATRQQSGVIEVVFDRLTLPSGSTFPISGRLTPTSSARLAASERCRSFARSRWSRLGGGGCGAYHDSGSVMVAVEPTTGAVGRPCTFPASFRRGS